MGAARARELRLRELRAGLGEEAIESTEKRVRGAHINPYFYEKMFAVPIPTTR